MLLKNLYFIAHINVSSVKSIMADVLPNEHVARLLSIYLGLYPQVIVAFSHEILSVVFCSLELVKVLKISRCLVVGTKSAPMLSPAKSGEQNTGEKVKL